MDFFNEFNESLGTYAFSRWIGQFVEEYQASRTLFLIAMAIFLAVLITSMIILRKWKNKEFLPEVKEFVGVGSGRPRFRKRDKVLFYGRKMLRKVKSISGQVHPTGQGKKRRAVMRFARRLLQLKKENAPQQLKVTIQNSFSQSLRSLTKKHSFSQRSLNLRLNISRRTWARVTECRLTRCTCFRASEFLDILRNPYSLSFASTQRS